ncbi:hypothetical protein AB4K20DRAFT_1901223 [Rhizopus microsporus]
MTNSGLFFIQRETRPLPKKKKGEERPTIDDLIMITSQRFMALTRPKIANARLITQIKQHPSIILLISFMNICNLIILTLLKLKKYMNLNLMCWNISSDYIIQLGNHFHSCRFSMYEQYDASIFMVKPR